MRKIDIVVHPGMDMYKKATSVASHYGFLPLEDVLGKDMKKHATKLKIRRNIDSLKGGLVLPIQYYFGSSSKPTLIYCLHQGKAARGIQVFSIAALGVSHSIAEAIILKTSLSILEDMGEKDIVVHLNSIGDRESSGKFVRECSAYLRKNLDSLSPQVQHIIRRDLFDALHHLSKRDHQLLDEIPRSVDFLSEESRKHFREVIEYLESGNILYQLDHRVNGSHECYSNTLFEIRRASAEDADGESAVLARGGRCDEFAKKFMRSDIPAVGMVFFFRPKRRERRIPQTVPRRPKVYFIHIGAEARFHSLDVIETLRQAKIPFRQSLSYDHLSAQLSEAEELDIPYTVIMGQKESVEGTVIVRNMDTRAQKTVSLPELPILIKSLAR